MKLLFCEKCGQGKEQIAFWENMEIKAQTPHIVKKMKINKYWKCQICQQNSYGEVDKENQITYCVVCNANNKMTFFETQIDGILKWALESINILIKSIIENNIFVDWFFLNT